MREVDVDEAGAMLAQLVEAVEAGEHVVLTRARKPVVRLVRLPLVSGGVQVGLLRGWLPEGLVDSIEPASPRISARVDA